MILVAENVLPGNMMALIAGMLLVALIIGVALYIYFAIALMAIAKKTKTPNGWLAFIPIANIYLMTQIAKLPGWYTLGILLAIIPFIGGIAFMVLFAYFWWKIAEEIGKPGWWGILMLIPVVNLILVGIMAWGK